MVERQDDSPYTYPFTACRGKALVREGQAAGEMGPDFDPEVAAFSLENLFMVISLPSGKIQTDEPTAWGGGIARYGEGLEVGAKPAQEGMR
jgi:hypothetical protein